MYITVDNTWPTALYLAEATDRNLDPYNSWPVLILSAYAQGN